MTIRCATCAMSFDVGDKEIIYDNGSDMAVYRHDRCNTLYLAVADDAAKTSSSGVVLFKLQKTKSFVTNNEVSSIIKPVATRMIMTPAEIAAEARRRK